MERSHDGPPPSGRPSAQEIHRPLACLLGLALASMTLVVGLCSTFATAVVPALAGVDDRTYLLLSQRFDDNPVFPLTFTAALLLVATTAAVQVGLSRGPSAAWSVGAAVLYGVGFAVTVAVHLPLNALVDAATLSGPAADLAARRAEVEGPWAAWNLVRTLACTLSLLALARALYLHGRSAPARQVRPALAGRAR